ncbi:hypothetical protein J2W23_002120 [Variovorax boronicumulans]|uniref:hypothetical protein n=1 Tax=Variovorax boronicumulans TaxID=436515 RepID=UPI00277F40B6|nr:hypothetical protein [Variovorax boronicumulans]MDQ0013738.1 hypothetical protein [Variovorax boronicumulans]
MGGSLLRFVGAIAVAIGLTACGGGGGGGGGGGFPLGAAPPAQPTGSGLPISPTFTTVNLSISSVTPASIKAEFYEGGSIDVNMLTGMATGDLSVVTGKTLYVILEDPDSLFKPNTQSIPFSSNGQGGVSVLVQPNPKKAGVYRGNINVYACLDSICSVRLGNVPFKIPYDVVVKRNTTFDANGSDSIAVSTPFSPDVQKIALKINPAEGTPMSSSEVRAGYSPLNVKSSLVNDGDGKGTLNLEIPAATLTGQYTLEYTFETRSNVGYVPPKRLTVKLDVAKNANVPYVFAPSPLTMTSSLANAVYYQTDGITVTQSQGTLALAQFPAEEILYTPEQQAAIPVEKRGRFIEASVRDYRPDPNLFFISLGHSACVRTAQSDPSTGLSINDCLPAGSYAFRIKFDYTANGATTPVYHQGTLVVTP